MATTRLIPRHTDKGRSILATIRKSLDYGKNPTKTRDGQLISTYECDPMTADVEFVLSKRQYFYITGRKQKKNEDILLYQIRQSFKPGEITPEEANELSYELAMRFTKGKHAFIVDTHEDKHHIHSHIYFNSTSLDCTRKFKNFWFSSKVVAKMSDLICAENGLSIIKNPKPSKGHYGTWLGDQRPVSFQTQLRQMIDVVLQQNPADFDSFLERMQEADVKISWRGKKLGFLLPGQKRPTRCDTLRGEYTEQAIRGKIENGIRTTDGDSFIPSGTQISLLIDIEARMRTGKGAGYEHWAKRFNLKEAAKTLVFLQENGLTNYEVLEKTVAEATSKWNADSKKIKQLESRMSDISKLQKHISNYRRTRDTYTQYRKGGYQKSFRVDNEKNIILHQAAKRYFDSLGLKKLPTINALRQEYAVHLAEKKTLYSQYHQKKESVQKLLAVKANTDRILRIPRPTIGKETLRL